MKIRLYLFLLTFSLAFLSYQVSHSFFSSTAYSVSNIFSTSATFPPLTPTPTLTITPTPTIGPSDIVINEVYSEGQAKGEWVELYNRTSFPINVSGWKISDKNAYDTGNDDTFPTVSPIPAGGYAVVITNNSTVSGIPSSAITITLTSANIGSGLNDDGDAVILKNSVNTIIDAMSYGKETVIFPSPPPAPAAGQSLARSPNGIDTNSALDWVIATTPSIGTSN